MNIKSNLEKIKSKISKDIKVIAVSKTKSNNEILEAYNCGQLSFGENKVQELIEKSSALPKDIEWHFIGHLQRNKVKFIIPFIHLIHSVDSFNLIDEINKRAEKENRIINCLIQVKIASEESKFGFHYSRIDEVLEYSKKLNYINIKGLMGMSTFTNNYKIIEEEFSLLNKVFQERKKDNFKILSMGMSNDYEKAILNGSNMIRLGSIIFGKRN